MSSAKKLRSAVALLLTLVLTLTMFTFPASVSALGLSKTSITLTKGYATTLTVTGANGASVSWSSSDKTVASVGNRKERRHRNHLRKCKRHKAFMQRKGSRRKACFKLQERYPGRRRVQVHHSKSQGLPRS